MISVIILPATMNTYWELDWARLLYFTSSISLKTPNNSMRCTIISILQMRKQRLGEIKDHPAKITQLMSCEPRM